MAAVAAVVAVAVEEAVAKVDTKTANNSDLFIIFSG
jgi:hypothetical protein